MDWRVIKKSDIGVGRDSRRPALTFYNLRRQWTSAVQWWWWSILSYFANYFAVCSSIYTAVKPIKPNSKLLVVPPLWMSWELKGGSRVNWREGAGPYSRHLTGRKRRLRDWVSICGKGGAHGGLGVSANTVCFQHQLICNCWPGGWGEGVRRSYYKWNTNKERKNSCIIWHHMLVSLYVIVG